MTLLRELAHTGCMATVKLEQTPIAEAPRCGRCGGKQLYRKERWGVWQTYIFPRLGLFPWKCPSCKKTYLRRLRVLRGGPISDW